MPQDAAVKKANDATEEAAKQRSEVLLTSLKEVGLSETDINAAGGVEVRYCCAVSLSLRASLADLSRPKQLPVCASSIESEAGSCGDGQGGRRGEGGKHAHALFCYSFVLCCIISRGEPRNLARSLFFLSR